MVGNSRLMFAAVAAFALMALGCVSAGGSASAVVSGTRPDLAGHSGSLDGAPPKSGRTTTQYISSAAGGGLISLDLDSGILRSSMRSVDDVSYVDELDLTEVDGRAFEPSVAYTDRVDRVLIAGTFGDLTGAILSTALVARSTSAWAWREPRIILEDPRLVSPGEIAPLPLENVYAILAGRPKQLFLFEASARANRLTPIEFPPEAAPVLSSVKTVATGRAAEPGGLDLILQNSEEMGVAFLSLDKSLRLSRGHAAVAGQWHEWTPTK